LALPICKALNDARRLAILYALRTGPHTVTQLCHAIQGPQSNTSRHLATLRDRGLIKAERTAAWPQVANPACPARASAIRADIAAQKLLSRRWPACRLVQRTAWSPNAGRGAAGF